jgi:hypothetical protein
VVNGGGAGEDGQEQLCQSGEQKVRLIRLILRHESSNLDCSDRRPASLQAGPAAGAAPTWKPTTKPGMRWLCGGKSPVLMHRLPPPE